MHAIAWHIRQNKPDIVDSTVAYYTSAIRRLRAVAPELSHNLVSQYLDGIKPTAALPLVSALVAYQGDRWKPLHTVYRKAADALRDTQGLSEREALLWVDAKYVRAAIRRMKQDVALHRLVERGRGLVRWEHNLLMGYIALTIHNIFHLRNDLPSVKIVSARSDAKTNSYVLSSSSLILFDFKTKRAFSVRSEIPVVLTFPRRVAKVLFRFAAKRVGEHLLYKRDGGGAYDKSSFRSLVTGVCKRYMGVRLGTTMLRHIYLTEFLSTNPSLLRRKRKMYEMQQVSLITQFRYDRPASERQSVELLERVPARADRLARDVPNATRNALE